MTDDRTNTRILAAHIQSCRKKQLGCGRKRPLTSPGGISGQLAASTKSLRRLKPELLSLFRSPTTALGRSTIDALCADLIDSAELRRRVEDRLGASGFMLLMKIEHDLLMGNLARWHRSVRYAIGNPSIAKDVSDAAPKVCLYTPLRIAVLEDEKDGSTWILYDNPESLMGSFGSAPARKIGNSLSSRAVEEVPSYIAGRGTIIGLVLAQISNQEPRMYGG